jgi:hypothetical protein
MKPARPCLLLLLMGALLLPAMGCQTDPYRIRHYGDGGPVGDWAVDLWTGWDYKPGVDVQPDTGHDLMSYDACLAQIELCNNVDDNCNGLVDEGFDQLKLTNTQYCENCKGCDWLLQKNAYPECINGTCAVKDCMLGYEDLNGDVTDGCEYGCTVTGPEICDGKDNDCDGDIDDQDSDFVPLTDNICKTIGPCKGITAVCDPNYGWVCPYPASVELLPCTTDGDCGGNNKCNTTKGVCPAVVALAESKCDGQDNDCDGMVDDYWAASKGQPCDLDNPPLSGTCRAIGVSACDPGGTKLTCLDKSCTTTADCAALQNLNPAITCVAGKCAAAAVTIETCNGVDDDCNGLVDDLVTDEQWVTVGSGTSAFQIFKYEASRPDGTASSSGKITTGRACSVPNRLPWGNITKSEAHAACVKADARLCSATEWELACKGSAGTKFPYGTTFDATKCNGRAYDTTKDAPLVTDQPTTCVSTWSGGTIFNMSGNLKEWVASAFSGTTPSGYKIRGGAYDTPSIDGFGEGLSCTYDLPDPDPNNNLSFQFPNLGFRCCKK